MSWRMSRLKYYLRGPGTWTKIVGWCQMIASILVLVSLVRTVNHLKASNEDTTYWYGKKLDHKAKSSVIVFRYIDIIQTVLAACFSIVLLFAAHKRNGDNLVAWIEFTVLLNFFYFISTTIETIEIGYIGVTIIQCAAVIVMRGFGITIVFRYKEKLQDESRAKLLYAVD